MLSLYIGVNKHVIKLGEDDPEKRAGRNFLKISDVMYQIQIQLMCLKICNPINTNRGVPGADGGHQISNNLLYNSLSEMSRKNSTAQHSSYSIGRMNDSGMRS